MNVICSYCKSKEVEKIMILYNVEYYHCLKCGKDFIVSKNNEARKV